MSNQHEFRMDWTSEAFIYQGLHDGCSSGDVGRSDCRKLADLFAEGNTVAFVARYRMHHLGSEVVRRSHELFREAEDIHAEAQKLQTKLQSTNELTPQVRKEIQSSRCVEELRNIKACFKSTTTSSRAEKARELGYGTLADRALQGYTDRLDSSEELGVIHILAEMIHRDPLIRSKIDTELVANPGIRLTCKGKMAKAKENDNTITERNKFSRFVDPERPYSRLLNRMEPHDILAINRAEERKFLTVTLEYPNDAFDRRFEAFVRSSEKFARTSPLVLKKTIAYTWKNLTQARIDRCVRRQAAARAQSRAIQVFAHNLRQKLLRCPLRSSSTLLVIDPGNSKCKIAVLSSNGQCVETGAYFKQSTAAALNVLNRMIEKHKCSHVVVGDGQGSGPALKLAARLASQHRIQYALVDESGASVYSATELAERELPGMETIYRAAVSIGRRVLDPLSEYVKIEPKHLGVGMYQHDIGEARLSKSLRSVVEECVSFVGVDVNACSTHVLEHIAGVGSTLAQRIVEYRKKKGRINSRAELLKIARLGEITYRQCAGFIRVYPSSSVSKVTYNPLDATSVHPESYELAERIITEILKYRLTDVGSAKLRHAALFHGSSDISQICKHLRADGETVAQILSALSQSDDFDYRSAFELDYTWRDRIQQLSDLRVGDVHTGEVKNVADFGAFVDIGCAEKQGLLHKSAMENEKLCIGQQLKVRIANIDIKARKIGLNLVKQHAANRILPGFATMTITPRREVAGRAANGRKRSFEDAGMSDVDVLMGPTCSKNRRM